MLGKAFAHFPRQVQAGKPRILLLQFLDDAQALAIVFEAVEILHQPIEHRLALVTERGVAEVVCQRNGLGEVLIKLERAGDVARNGGHLHRMGQPRAEVIAGAVEKHLGLVFEPAKGPGVNDAVTVPLILRAPLRRRFPMLSPARIGAELRIRGKALSLERLQFLLRAGHALGGRPQEIRTHYASSSCCTEMPRSSNRRRMASSIRLFGQDAPAVIPTVILPEGSQWLVSISSCRCWS